MNDGVPGEGALIFDGAMVDHRWEWTSYWSGPVYVTYAHQTILGDTWMAGRPELPWADLLTSYPGQLIGHRNEVEWWSDSLMCIAQHGLDAQGRYTYGCKLITDPLSGTGRFMSVPFEPPTSAPVSTTVRGYCDGAPDEEFGVLYTAGIGLNWLHGNYFESFEEYVLIGSVIGGDTVGTVDTDEHIITLSVPFGEASSAIVLAPNPASDHLLLSRATPGTNCSIIDLNGRVVATHRITSANERIDVQALPTGAYVLRMDGSAPQRFMIVR
ncbi:MAG: T9SS type A sorting domain-containing protein [Flavobacteriales bacterium]